MDKKKIMNIGVRFVMSPPHPSRAREYHYKTDLDVQPGDLVVVPARDTLQVVQVTSIDVVAVPFKGTLRWAIQVVDLKAHRAYVTRMETVEALKEQMESRRAELLRLNSYRLLAEHDPEMRKLLEALNEIAPEEGIGLGELTPPKPTRKRKPRSDKGTSVSAKSK